MITGAFNEVLVSFLVLEEKPNLHHWKIDTSDPFCQREKLTPISNYRFTSVTKKMLLHIFIMALADANTFRQS